MIATLLVRMPCELGEGPTWYKSRKTVFWVDILEKSIHEYDPATQRTNTWQIGHYVSLIIEQDQDNMLLAIQGGLASFNIQTRSLTLLAEIESGHSTNRTNDGAADPRGNIWIGTMDMHCAPDAGALYVVDHAYRVTRKLDRLSVPNGLVFDPAKNLLYHIDSATQQVRSYSYDPETLAMQFRKTILEIPKEKGSPDGMTIDAEGMLWIAQWGGFCVSRWNPETGQLLATIEVPVPHVSACIFGGENLDQLYITTARENLSADDLKKYPDSGSLYVAQPGVKGRKL